MVKQYTVFWVKLDPTVGSEINKTRPAVIISPDEPNNLLNTVIVAPITSSIRKFPMRVNVVLHNKKGQIALDQMRCLDKSRILSVVGKLSRKEVKNLKATLKEFLVE